MSVKQEPTRFLNESELEKVNIHFKHTVFGYVRRQKMNHLSTNGIPKLVTVIILAFYADDLHGYIETLSNITYVIKFHVLKCVIYTQTFYRPKSTIFSNQQPFW